MVIGSDIAVNHEKVNEHARAKPKDASKPTAEYLEKIAKQDAIAKISEKIRILSEGPQTPAVREEIQRLQVIENDVKNGHSTGAQALAQISGIESSIKDTKSTEQVEASHQFDRALKMMDTATQKQYFALTKENQKRIQEISALLEKSNPSPKDDRELVQKVLGPNEDLGPKAADKITEMGMNNDPEFVKILRDNPQETREVSIKVLKRVQDVQVAIDGIPDKEHRANVELARDLDPAMTEEAAKKLKSAAKNKQQSVELVKETKAKRLEHLKENYSEYLANSKMPKEMRERLEKITPEDVLKGRDEIRKNKARKDAAIRYNEDPTQSAEDDVKNDAAKLFIYALDTDKIEREMFKAELRDLVKKKYIDKSELTERQDNIATYADQILNGTASDNTSMQIIAWMNEEKAEQQQKKKLAILQEKTDSSSKRGNSYEHSSIINNALDDDDINRIDELAENSKTTSKKGANAVLRAKVAAVNFYDNAIALEAIKQLQGKYKSAAELAGASNDELRQLANIDVNAMRISNVFDTDLEKSKIVIDASRAKKYAEEKLAGASEKDAQKAAGDAAGWERLGGNLRSTAVNGFVAVVSNIAGNKLDAAIATEKVVNNVAALAGQAKNAVGTKVDQGLEMLGIQTLDNQIAKHMDAVNFDEKFAKLKVVSNMNGKKVFGDGKGNISHEELVTSLKKHFKVESDSDLYKILDKDGKDGISQNELLTVMNQVMKEERIAGAKQKVADDKALTAQLQKNMTALNKNEVFKAVSNNNGAKVFNTNNDKELSTDEIQKVLAKHGITKVEQLDTIDKDGQISQAELTRALKKIMDEEREEGLKQKKKDDAYKADIKELLDNKLVEELKKKKITVSIKEYDSNGDGKLDLKDQDKIIAVLKEKGIDLSEIDKNNKGDITLEELGAAMATPKTPTTEAKKTAETLSKS